MASPFMNMLSYWFFFLASVVMMVSLFISTGPASGGWTMYPPLSALGPGKPGIETWYRSLDLLHGLICGFFFARWFKLRGYYP
jgi:cytochrome c oxidase subunit 1